ncbi:MAG: Exopolysaccharide biosynthesis protein YbjH [Variovorax sp.]|nr:Exopolysaccharide biosynthesis protein YbjH [Variovorax sp.]
MKAQSMGRIHGVMAAGMLVGLGAAQPSLAQQGGAMSASGFTGWSVTPTARLLPWGSVSLAYDSELVGAPVSGLGTGGHNFVAGFGLLPNLEVSGRMAANTLQTHCYTEACGLRDLSANFKAGMPLDSALRWHAAIGMTDVGGQASFFRSTYGVLTYSPDKLDLSLGYARRGGTAAVNPVTALKGVFASAAYRPLSWAQTHVEYTNGKAWAGARLFAPAEWLPAGWSAHAGINVRLRGDERTARSWWSLGLNIPLYKVPTTRTVESSPAESGLASGAPPDAAPASRLAQRREFSTQGLPVSTPPEATSHAGPGLASSLDTSGSGIATSEPAPVSDDRLRELAEALRAQGFEDIGVGRMPDGAIAVQVNNATYNVNTADGLGVALGVIARRLGEARSDYRLVLTQRQTAIVGVAGRADCLAQWIAGKSPGCNPGRLLTPGATAVDSLVRDARWLGEPTAPSWSTMRLVLEPVLRSTIGTEYGVFDYSLGLRATVQQPLWRGAYAEVSHVAPLQASSDFRDPAVFGSQRLTSVTDRVLVHQVWRLPVERLWAPQARSAAARWGADAVTAHVTAGRINESYRGAYGELRWEPAQGRHRFGIEGGRFERIADSASLLPATSHPLLGSYRYSFTPTHTDFEVTAGQFLHNDTGARVGVKQWFHDVAVSFYVRRTKFDWDRSARTFAGVELSIPLTPRKDMTPTHHVQVTGTPQWSHSVETVVRQAQNFVTSGQGVLPGVAVLDRTFNADRAGSAYFEDNLARIRSAAAR